MGFTYNESSNTLTIKEIGINIRYLYNKEKENLGLENPYNDILWEDGLLIIETVNEQRSYEIFLNNTQQDYYFLLKVKTVYFDTVFQDFFQLENDCSNWCKHIIIGVRKDQRGSVMFI